MSLRTGLQRISTFRTTSPSRSRTHAPVIDECEMRPVPRDGPVVRDVLDRQQAPRRHASFAIDEDHLPAVRVVWKEQSERIPRSDELRRPAESLGHEECGPRDPPAGRIDERAEVAPVIAVERLEPDCQIFAARVRDERRSLCVRRGTERPRRSS
jgi:hypothetical protein